jgi:hypothetical protein
MKTNWVTQPVTNIVELDLTKPTDPGAQGTAKGASEEAAVNSGTPWPATLTDDLALEGELTKRAPANNQAEVLLRVRWKANAASPVPVQQWRVEREGGGVLCFGRGQEFRRELPEGRYKVEVKAQQDSKSPLIAARGILTVSLQNASIEQRLVAKR